jgi:hypothetical protein
MTMPELASWTYALFTGRVVSPASTEIIASPGVAVGDGESETPGWVAVDDSVFGTPAFAAAGGGGEGHNAVVVWLPELERVVAIASNGPEVTAEDLMAAIAPALAAGDPLPRPSEPVNAVDTAAIVGTYALGTGGSFEVTEEGDRPVLAATGADAVTALFPRREGFAEHEALVTALLEGRTQEGRKARAELEDTTGPVTGFTVVGTVEQDGELRTYVTVVAGGQPVLCWYALNEFGAIEAVELATAPPSAVLSQENGRFRLDGLDVTVAFGDGELTVTGPAGSTTAKRAG